jgi:U3 small nucleolar RNA-associated protein 3
MAKKRKASGRAEQSENNGFEDKGGKMGRITTYEDVADSEDEFHINRDKVLLDDGPDAKRRKKWQEEGRNTASIGIALLYTLLTGWQMLS